MAQEYIDIFVSAIPAVATIVAAIITVAVTFSKNKKMRFFEIYFSKKSDVFNGFINSLLYLNTSEPDGLVELRLHSYNAVLYCNDETEDLINDLLLLCTQLVNEYERDAEQLDEGLIHKLWKDIDVSISKVVKSMKKEILNCTAFKFK